MTEDRVQDHYTHGDLLAAILEKLRQAGKDIDRLSVDDLAPVDHLHGRGREATEELLAALAPLAEDHVLDIGSGIGGPARFIAQRAGCRVTGIDLTAEFVQVGDELSRLTKLSERVAFHQASALDLPFETGTFDRAYTHNVSMSIADKTRFFEEAFRVLKPGGRFVAIEIADGPGGDVIFPVPWAMTADISHLWRREETEDALGRIGFKIVRSEDTTERALAWQAENRKRIEREGMPLLTPMVVLREDAMARMKNSARNLAEDRIRAVEFICDKPKSETTAA